MPEHIQRGDGPCEACGGPHEVPDWVLDRVAAIILSTEHGRELFAPKPRNPKPLTKAQKAEVIEAARARAAANTGGNHG